MVELVGNQIKLSNSIKYLAVTFSKNATHHRHKEHSKALNRLRYLRQIPPKIMGFLTKKMLCYKQLIRPILAHSFPAWSSIFSAQMEKLRLTERKCLKGIYTSIFTFFA